MIRSNNYAKMEKVSAWSIELSEIGICFIFYIIILSYLF